MDPAAPPPAGGGVPDHLHPGIEGAADFADLPIAAQRAAPEKIPDRLAGPNPGKCTLGSPERGFNALAQFGNQSGTPFPFSPKWQSITNFEDTFPVAAAIKGFLGGSLTYNSKTYAGVGALDTMRIDSFALLDLRAGVEFANRRYRIWAWGQNVTDKYYWSNVFANGNAIARFVGQPATYGVSFSGRF